MVRNRDNYIRKEYSNFTAQEVKWTGYTSSVSIGGGLINFMEKRFSESYDHSYYPGPREF